VNIVEAVLDRKLLGAAFRDLESWSAWLAFLRAVFALPMSAGDLAAFTRHTGRSSAPAVQAREAWLVVGRRGGKSRVSALVAVFLAAFRDYGSVLAPGERGVVMCLAQDRRQAAVILRYVRGMLEASKLLAGMVTRETKDGVDLSNGVSIEVHTANFRHVRGYTVVAAICDEIAFWWDEGSANPDVEILNGIRPSMATVPGSLLLCISSPYARRGELYRNYREHFGKDGDRVLVWQADTRSMNPLVSENIIADAYERDPSSAAAEYGAQFRSDIESFVSLESLEALVVPDRRSLPPVPGVSYRAFCDPSGGSGDSFTLAVAHLEGDRAVLDLALERRPPFSPEAVVEEFAAVLSQYRIASVTGDRYGGEFPRELFSKRGIYYEPSEKAKSDLYRELLPLLNAAKVELLDDRRLLTQLAGLERRTARGGKDSIDHAPSARDDVANSVAGALVRAAGAGVMPNAIPTEVSPLLRSRWDMRPDGGGSREPGREIFRKSW
jgi:hypothetical protein